MTDRSIAQNQAGLGAFIEYDDRNSTFTPTDGLRALAEFRNYGDTWGSDFDYDRYRVVLHDFTPFESWSSLGLQLEGEKIYGNAPLFGYPFVNLRGKPAMCYEGECVITAETEFLWGVTAFWSLALFGGVGRTTAIGLFGSDGRTVGAGGVGFRYRLARKLGLRAGVDVARGPEETAIYLTIGNSWN